VDSKDFQLLVSLHSNARQSYQSLGMLLSLSAHSVRDQLDRLKSKGILQGFMLTIDSSLYRPQTLPNQGGNWEVEKEPNELRCTDRGHTQRIRIRSPLFRSPTFRCDLVWIRK
jgi:hypothetical protein